MCSNIRAGNWLLGYLAAHLAKRKHLLPFADYLKKVVAHLEHMPQNIRPDYAFQVCCLPCFCPCFDAAALTSFTIKSLIWTQHTLPPPPLFLSPLLCRPFPRCTCGFTTTQ